MGVTTILTVFGFLFIGSPCLPQAVSLEVPRSSHIEHHRTRRQETPVDPCPPTTEGWVNNEDNCFYFSSQQTGVALATWTEAEAACAALPHGNAEKATIRLAELANPENLKSDLWLMGRIVEQGQEVWLGAKAVVDGSNDFQWSSGRSLPQLNPYWGPDQPNNHLVDQDCISTIKEGDITPNRRQYFNDEVCTKSLAYVCQLFPI